MLAYAVEHGWAANNAANGSRVTGEPKREEMAFLDAVQLLRLADAMDLPEYRTLVMVAGTTGLRAGEIAGLRVGSVDLSTGMLTISETVIDVDGVLVEQSFTKNKKRRRDQLGNTSVGDQGTARPQHHPGDARPLRPSLPCGRFGARKCDRRRARTRPPRIAEGHRAGRCRSSPRRRRPSSLCVPT